MSNARLPKCDQAPSSSKLRNMSKQKETPQLLHQGPPSTNSVCQTQTQRMKSLFDQQRLYKKLSLGVFVPWRMASAAGAQTGT